jgi:hypothetical protein
LPPQLRIFGEERGERLRAVDRTGRLAQDPGGGTIDAGAGREPGTGQPGIELPRLLDRDVEGVGQLGQGGTVVTPSHQLGEDCQPGGDGKL